ncbi:hypothetical protein CLAIMM_00659 [Cladophialophora immunda]|nr:hypothetical protein CLAIMM_00659 [Cladophialophora immunda]
MQLLGDRALLNRTLVRRIFGFSQLSLRVCRLAPVDMQPQREYQVDGMALHMSDGTMDRTIRRRSALGSTCIPWACMIRALPYMNTRNGTGNSAVQYNFSLSAANIRTWLST